MLIDYEEAAFLAKLTYNRDRLIPLSRQYKYPFRQRWIMPARANESQQVLTLVSRDRRLLVVCYRGSHTVWDWLSPDVAILMGNESKHPRFLRHVREFERIRAEFPKSNVVLIGHSLGGAIAFLVDQKTAKIPKEIHLFNMGAGLGALKRLVARPTNSDIHLHHARGDPLSALALIPSKHYDIHILDTPTMLPHSIDNFLRADYSYLR